MNYDFPSFSARLGAIYLLVLTIVLQSCETNSDQKPEDNRFVTSVLSDPGSLDEPMAFTFLNNREMLVVERKGGVKSFDVDNQEMRTIGHVLVNTKYVNKEGQSREAEEGLMGIIAHPEYEQNHWIFMFYADPSEPKHVLARWEYKEDSLYQDSKVVVLEYPAQREVCCHTGGGMVFDKDGNLYLTTGNNTANPPRGTSNLDERPGHENDDDQRTAGNTNDLRGKIIRIHPEDDGSYSIPDGNLFPPGTAKTKPEIYTMGHRNPWRISIDHKTGYIYWGEVGPDASGDTDFGPMGYDEFNQARGPGFFGWPYFIGNNLPYADYDFETDSIGLPFDFNQVINESPNNSGLRDLPPAEPALIWYPYSPSETFPLLGSAGRSATGGPLYRQNDFPKSENRFPPYYEGKWLIVEFMRGWIIAVTLDKSGDYESMESFLPEENFSSAIEMQFSPGGDLFVLEYGSAWFRGNENAQIKRIRYNGGNRAPVVRASSDQYAGQIPLTIHLSSEGTTDYDNDPLRYNWSMRSDNGFEYEVEEANPSMVLSEPGIYTAELTVTDKVGNSDNRKLEIVAGNALPDVDIVIEKGNRSFFFAGDELTYRIKVSDEEDGSSEAGEINPDAISVNFDYVPEGFDPIEIAQNHRGSDDWVVFSRGKILISEGDCLSCHRDTIQSIGPSYLSIAQTYQDNLETRETLAGRIVNGSVGFWGEHAMSAHPDLSREQALSMVDYIMSLDDISVRPPVIPLEGDYKTVVPPRENGRGGYLLRAAYTDRGVNDLRSLTGEKIIALRNPVLIAEAFDYSHGTLLLTTPGRSFNITENGGYVGFAQLDLSGIAEIAIDAEASQRIDAAGGVIEVRLDKPDGEIIGTTEMITPVDIDFRAELAKLRAAWEEGGRKGPRPGFGEVREMLKPKYIVPLTGVKGIHDLYFIVRNPEVKTGQILLQLNSFTFKNRVNPIQ